MEEEEEGLSSEPLCDTGITLVVDPEPLLEPVLLYVPTALRGVGRGQEKEEVPGEEGSRPRVGRTPGLDLPRPSQGSPHRHRYFSHT